MAAPTADAERRKQEEPNQPGEVKDGGAGGFGSFIVMEIERGTIWAARLPIIAKVLHGE